MTSNIETVNINDEKYPKLLKEIKNPPQTLFYKGKLVSDELCFGMVGTRIPSHYGKQIAMDFTAQLCEAGLTIVSGMAPGIDTFCHQAVLEQNKRTIAVLGTGLDEKSIYPQSNLKLAERIIENNGCLISEYPPGTPGSKITFPNRNRIISGLSLGILVIEGKQKSGTLITANWARKQNRKVFAVPGSIYSSNSKGCNYLIKTTALLVENANDILEGLNLKKLNPNQEEELISENKEEYLILKALGEGALCIDEIIIKTNLDAPKVNSTLAILSMKGKVKELEGNIYALTR